MTMWGEARGGVPAVARGDAAGEAPGEAPTVAPVRRWPWLHAVAAAVFALGVSAAMPVVVVPFVWWGAIAFVAAVAVVAVVSCLLGAFIASVFVSGAARAVGVVGAVSALVVSAFSSMGQSWPGGFVVVALVGASSALLAHSGSARIVGLVLGLLAAAMVAWAVVGVASSSSLDAAEAGFGTRVAPYVTAVAGFDRGAAVATPMEGIALEYESRGARFLLSTEPIVDDDTVTVADQVCMLPLDVLDVNAPLDAVSCERVDGGWARRSDTRHEIAVAVDGAIVRAGADLSVDEALLRSAIDGIEPIADDAYRKLLAGD